MRLGDLIVPLLTGLLAIVLLSVANAQQPTPMETVLGNKLVAEINSGLQCSAAAISTRAELDKALARIKELEAKQEPEK